MNYDAIPAVRRSDLWEIRKSPAHYLYKVMNHEEPTPALLFGTAAHKYILEPDEFWDCYILAPQVDRRTKAGKEEWAAFLEESEDKEVITPDDFRVIEEMAAAFDNNLTAQALILGGRHEVPLTWTDTDTGEPCKCKPDVLTEYKGTKYIVDYKTTTSCEDGAFERACRKYGYKLQAGMYREGVFQNTFEMYKFAFVVQEKTPPYVVRVYFCDDEFCAEGYDIYRELIGKVHKCKEERYWPGYDDADLLAEG